MEAVGLSVALAQVAFSAACKAVDGFSSALRYYDDTEALAVALELERLRLQTWGTSSGLADGQLVASLVIAKDILIRQLESISRMFGDADKLRERYGAQIEAPLDDNASVDTNGVSRLIFRMRKSLRTSGVQFHTSIPDEDASGVSDDKSDKPRSNSSRELAKKARWVLRDKDQLKALIASLRDEIDLLNKLLTETQQARFLHDYDRIRIVAVDSAVDPPSLSWMEAAVSSQKDTQALMRVKSKALADNEPWTRPVAASVVALTPLRLSQYRLPDNYATYSRFLATTSGSGEPSVFLFERKDFDPNIDPDAKNTLFSRVQRLIMLLNIPKSSAFKAPRAAGFAHDPTNFCWWLIFHFPTSGVVSQTQPLSMLQMLQTPQSTRPPLETRLRLANDICATFLELYSSGWMHKSIRSDNILFPTVTQSTSISRQIASPQVCGFEYSRQETESQTIDRSKKAGKVSIAMYRHPDYQGEAAQGYKIQYDIYSLGLILVEIGLWAPLINLFDPKPPKPPKTQSQDLSPPPTYIWRDMQHFHSEEARVLRKRVLSTAEKELPFRMGSIYANAVRWCLTFGDAKPQSQGEDATGHPALEFYNNAVEPLSSLNKAHIEAGEQLI